MRIRDLPVRSVAYIRVTRPYQGDAVVSATRRLVAWAEREGLANGQWLGYQRDNPEITALVDCRYHVAVKAERCPTIILPSKPCWVARTAKHRSDEMGERFCFRPVG